MVTEIQPELHLLQILWVQLTEQPWDATLPSSEPHTTSARVRQHHSLPIVRFLLPIMLFETETCTLGESSEGKLMQQQCPFNQEAVIVFLLPGTSLERCLPQGHRTASYHQHQQITWLCVLGLFTTCRLPPGEGETTRYLTV